MLSTLFGRTARWTVSLVAVVATVLVGTAIPASAAASGTVKTSGTALSVRRAPSLKATVVGSVANGTQISIDCQQTGSLVTGGTYEDTYTWDYVPSLGGYVSDAYIYTGSNGRIAPDCGVGTGSAQCNPGDCAAEARFVPGDGSMVVYDKLGDGHSAVVQYWLRGGVGPLTVWNPNGTGTSVTQKIGVAAGDWVFYRVCVGEHGTRTVDTRSCSAGLTDYR
ncbi:hypothetical protein [Goodfellowiella coeruleoviolacea]|nr:hypothetical protein [Goodfellowiella coeruleoviolacea]